MMDDYQSLWSRLLHGARLQPHRDMFVVSGAPTINDDDAGASLALDERHDVVLDGEGWRSCRRLTMSLLEEPFFSSRGDFPTLNVELIHEVGRILRSRDTEVTVGTVVQRLRTYVASSVVVVPLGGMYSSARDPLRLGDRLVVGHVSRETEGAIAKLARMYSHELAGFRFTDEAWWTEDFLAAEEDESVAEAIEEEEADGQSWQPLVVAVGVDGIGGPATYIATFAAEALIGAALALGDPKDLAWVAPPWVLGRATFAENPRSPVFGDDLLLPTAVLAVDSRPRHGIAGHADNEHGRLGTGIDLGELADTHEHRAFLTLAATGCLMSDPSAASRRRFSLACRAFAQVVASPPEVGVLLAPVPVQLLEGAEGVLPQAKNDRSTELVELVTSFVESGGGETQVQDLALARIETLRLLREYLVDAGRHLASSHHSPRHG
jgi:hypothetical protein